MWNVSVCVGCAATYYCDVTYTVNLVQAFIVEMALVVLLLLELLLSLVNSQSIPHVRFMDQTLANHSYVDLSLVGYYSSGSDSVQCITDLDTCCSYGQGFVHRGDWYFPWGDRLPFSGSIAESRGAQRVDLRHRNSVTDSPSGIFRCDISTNAVHDDIDRYVRDTVYVGLYTGSGGMLYRSYPLTAAG